MSDRLIVVSSDCHAGLRVSEYKPWVESKYHSLLDQAVPIQIEMSRKAEKSFLIQEINDEWRKDIQQELTGAWDYQQRLKMLDGDGIAAEIIFPDGITEINAPPFGAGLSLPTKDQVPELQWAGAMAHNRWLADFCANNPDRHYGVAIIPLLWDVELAVQNTRWCVEHGLKGVMIPAMWGDKDPYHHRKYDSFWAACEEMGVVVHFHSGPADTTNYFGANWPADNNPDLVGAMGIYVSEVMWWLYRPLTFMIWGGVFERFPKLRTVMTEGGTTFMIPPWLRLLDHNYRDVQFSAKLGDFRSHLSLSPSEYFQRNIAIGASCIPRRDVEIREQVGVRKLMWGSDYPHPEGTWPNTCTMVTDTFKGFPEQDVRAILGGNAVEWYGFSAPRLQAIADRIGPNTASLA